MRVITGYKRVSKLFRHKVRVVSVATYKEMGKGGTSVRFSRNELKRET